MTDIFPLVDRRSKKDNIKNSEKSNNSTRKRVWYKFIKLASNFRFKLKAIKELLEENSNKIEIQVSLYNWQPKELYKINNNNFKSKMDCQLQVLYTKFK